MLALSVKHVLRGTNNCALEIFNTLLPGFLGSKAEARTDISDHMAHRILLDKAEVYMSATGKNEFA